MRPTASSASKTQEKADFKSPPKGSKPTQATKRVVPKTNVHSKIQEAKPAAKAPAKSKGENSEAISTEEITKKPAESIPEEPAQPVEPQESKEPTEIAEAPPAQGPFAEEPVTESNDAPAESKPSAEAPAETSAEAKPEEPTEQAVDTPSIPEEFTVEPTVPDAASEAKEPITEPLDTSAENSTENTEVAPAANVDVENK